MNEYVKDDLITIYTCGHFIHYKCDLGNICNYKCYMCRNNNTYHKVETLWYEGLELYNIIDPNMFKTILIKHLINKKYIKTLKNEIDLVKLQKEIDDIEISIDSFVRKHMTEFYIKILDQYSIGMLNEIIIFSCDKYVKEGNQYLQFLLCGPLDKGLNYFRELGITPLTDVILDRIGGRYTVVVKQYANRIFVTLKC